MRLRLIAFVPVAMLVSFLISVSVSSLVSALAESILVRTQPSLEPIRIQPFESECDRLSREFETIMQFSDIAYTSVARNCQLKPRCLESPLLCPIATDIQIEREYQRLRIALHTRCEVPLALVNATWGGPFLERPVCERKRSGTEGAGRDGAERGTFVF